MKVFVDRTFSKALKSKVEVLGESNEDVMRSKDHPKAYAKAAKELKSLINVESHKKKDEDCDFTTQITGIITPKTNVKGKR